jgi:hypothetical protein
MVGYRVGMEKSEGGISDGRATMLYILTYRMEFDSRHAAYSAESMTSHVNKHGGS